MFSVLIDLVLLVSLACKENHVAGHCAVNGKMNGAGAIGHGGVFGSLPFYAFENITNDILFIFRTGIVGSNDNEIALALGKSPALVRRNSKCLSADVTACYDPNFAFAYERRNSSMLSCGAAICKFTGSGGKGGSSDANAEFVGFVRKLFDDNGVIWQTAELGRVDAGGGGTVAKFIAKLNIDVIDIGVPVISMHAPYELISKADLYSTFEAFACFIK